MREHQQKEAGGQYSRGTGRPEEKGLSASQDGAEVSGSLRKKGCSLWQGWPTGTQGQTRPTAIVWLLSEENVCQSCLPSRHCRAWRVMQVSRTEPGTEGVQQTAASCCGPALCPRTLAVTVALLLWLEPKGPRYEIFRQVCLNSILKSPNDLSDEFLAQPGDHAYCMAEAPALARQVLVPHMSLLHTRECLDVAQSRSQLLGQNAGHSHWFPQCVPATFHISELACFISCSPPQHRELGAHTLMQMKM